MLNTAGLHSEASARYPVDCEGDNALGFPVLPSFLYSASNATGLHQPTQSAWRKLAYPHVRKSTKHLCELNTCEWFERNIGKCIGGEKICGEGSNYETSVCGLRVESRFGLVIWKPRKVLRSTHILITIYC